MIITSRHGNAAAMAGHGFIFISSDLYKRLQLLINSSWNGIIAADRLGLVTK